jgi:hypothetical protein
MVRGTGREVDDRPLLEIQFSSGLDEFREGDSVFTRGRDGIYPEGVLIGHAIWIPRTTPGASPGATPGTGPGTTPGTGPGAGPGAGSDSGRWAIRAAVSVRELARIEFAADTYRGVAAEARRLDEGKEKR